MSDIEGAVCDECGTIIGSNGCCATIRTLRAHDATQTAAIRKVRDEMAGALRDDNGHTCVEYSDPCEACECVKRGLTALNALLRERE